MIVYLPLGSNAKDVSGNDYHGELTKGVKWEANGKVKRAAKFDGAVWPHQSCTEGISIEKRP